MYNIEKLKLIIVSIRYFCDPVLIICIFCNKHKQNDKDLTKKLLQIFHYLDSHFSLFFKHKLRMFFCFMAPNNYHELEKIPKNDNGYILFNM